MRVEERLLKYVSYWTTSDEECRQIPSSERQFELGKVLEQELRDLGLEKVTLTDHCYVYGLLPATKGYADKPAVGFISHMDTAPDFSVKDVKPQILSLIHIWTFRKNRRKLFRKNVTLQLKDK